MKFGYGHKLEFPCHHGHEPDSIMHAMLKVYRLFMAEKFLNEMKLKLHARFAMANLELPA